MNFIRAEPQQFLEKIKKDLFFTEFLPTLRVCVTEKCTLNCFYCHREGMKGAFNDYLSIQDYEFLATAFRNIGLKKIKITGGEPLLHPEIEQIVKTFKEASYEDVSLITNGTILNEPILEKLKRAGLDRITISIDTLKKKNAQRISNCSDIDNVLKNAILAKKFFDKVKVNCVVISGINFPDEILEIANFCRDNGLTLKLLSQLSEDNPYPLSHQALSIIKLYKTLVKKEQITNSPVLSTRHYFSDGTIIEINAIQTDEYRKKIAEHPLCKNCVYKSSCVEGPCAIRIMPNGDVKPCIAREDNAIKFKKIEKRPIKIICLTGLASAGKSNFCQIASKNFGIKNVYFGKILKEIVQKKGEPITYNNVMKVGEQIQTQYGSLGVLLKSFERIEPEIIDQKIIIVDSVRGTEQYAFLSQFFETYLVGVICSKEERFNRAKSGDFKLTTTELEKRDKIELGEIKTIHNFNVAELLARADYYISGEAKDYEKRVNQIVEEIMND